MKIVDSRTPRSPEEARALLRELGEGGLPIAGATSLPFLRGDRAVTAVDLTRAGLAGIAARDGVFTVGATTPVCALQSHRAAGWALDRVARRLASQQIRNVSTLGGNIARVFWWSDFPVALLALNAVIVVQGEGETPFTADEFFTSQPANRLRPGELVTAIRIPALGPDDRFGYHKQTVVSASFSLVTAAACLALSKGVIKRIRLAVGGAVPMPCRLPDVEACLKGRAADPAEVRRAVAQGARDVRWVPREGLSAEYAADLANTVIQEAITEAAAGGKPV